MQGSSPFSESKSETTESLNDPLASSWQLPPETGDFFIIPPQQALEYWWKYLNEEIERKNRNPRSAHP